MMSMQLFHRELRVLSAQWLPRIGPSEPPRSVNCALSTEFQDLDALAVAVELIEMTYHVHCARVKLEVLFADGELNCL
jgi:hypothetical protein